MLKLNYEALIVQWIEYLIAVQMVGGSIPPKRAILLSKLNTALTSNRLDDQCEALEMLWVALDQDNESYGSCYIVDGK